MTDIDLLREAEMRLEQAQLSSDVDLLDILLHPQVTYVGPDGELVTKEADLALIVRGSCELISWTARPSMSGSKTESVLQF